LKVFSYLGAFSLKLLAPRLPGAEFENFRASPSLPKVPVSWSWGVRNTKEWGMTFGCVISLGQCHQCYHTYLRSNNGNPIPKLHTYYFFLINFNDLKQCQESSRLFSAPSLSLSLPVCHSG
jgi:hypothetical protein